MVKVIKTTFLLRRGYEEVWMRNNPILQRGEPAFTIDKNGLKIGDGVHPWKELEYINSEDVNLEDYVMKEELEALEQKVEDLREHVENNYISKDEVLVLYGGSASDNI